MDELCDRPLKITKICSIAAGVVDLSVVENENYVKGGILSNPKLSWVSCGPRISNINTDDGSKRTAWTFGWALGDPSYKVICVEELTANCHGSPILIVGCESEKFGSSLCFYHSGSSRVLKAVHFNEKLTSLAVISKSNDEDENLSELLKVWSGVVAVGIGTGKVYLLDVWWTGLQKCIEDYQLRPHNEQRQSKVTEITIQDLRNGIECETSSIRHGSSTLALWLNEGTLQSEGSRDHPGVQNILGRMPLKLLTVSALKYFPQIATLAVGYNTSCFQLWNLTSLTLLHTSALLEAMLPVFSFSLLQPSDDPKYVCYLWSLHHSVNEDNIPFAAMYILSYHRKLLNPFSSQPLYQEFSSCSIRYQLDLGAEIDSAVSGRIIACQAITRCPKSSPIWLQTESEENGSEENIATLLVIAWEVWTASQLGVFKKLTMFDLNQWYREYMPQSPDTEFSHFMTHFCLPDGPLLDVKVIPSSVKQFATLQPVDEHFFPSATSFDCVCLQHSHILACSHLGMQKECLQALQEGGSSSLLLPSRLYKMFMQAGIRPLLVDTTPSSQSNEQREYLLSVAMEYGMTQFLRNCVRDWSDGSHAVAGCTLPSLLHWAWRRVERYKNSLDALCVPLFDFSGAELDNNNFGIFHHMICQLHNLDDLFRLVLNKYSNCILEGNYQQQHMAIKLVTSFYDSVLWCVRNKVLPETNISDANNGHVPYFTDKIVNTTISRRAELHHIGKSLKHPVPLSGLFLIDAVIAQEADGSKLTDQWEREGGITTMGKYPPPSVQSLLRTYLVKGIPIHIKHFIVSYFLHDIVHILGSQRLSDNIKQKLLRYPSDFGLSESQCKIIHAFWCLDHKDYENGVTLLLDSCINKEDLQLYQHRTIICLLVAAGKHKMALHYLNIRRPGLVNQQDIKMKMTLLLMNNLIHEAFEFQRQHHTCRADLLEQFFTGCIEMNKLDVAFKLPLNLVEEEAFMTFLEKTCHPQADDLRVLYLLAHSRYVEALDMNEKLRTKSGVKRGAAGLPLGYSPLGPRSRNLFGSKDEVTGAPTKTVLTTRDLIINSVAKSLPSVTRDLADYCSKEKQFSWKQVNRPTPLSVVVHTELTNERLPFYRATDSTLVQAALAKTRETWAPLLATPVALKRKLSSAIDDIPFLRTPVMPRFTSSVSHLSPSSELKGGVHLRADDDHSNISKKLRLEFSPSLEKDFNKGDDTFNKTMDMDITCPESSALLHTPHVSRVVKQQTKEITTPQSILKLKSAANTATPVSSERSLKSSSSSRQIRFSLPHERSPTSSSLSLVDDEEHYSPIVSRRKSIHEKSSIQGRKGTPANPRILKHQLRSAVSRLTFDNENTSNTQIILQEPSATAASLLKKISLSPVSSEEAYLSFQSSSSSMNTRSRESGLSFNLPLGLEGNIMNFEEDVTNKTQQEDVTLTDTSDCDLVGSESVENISSAEEVIVCSSEMVGNQTKELKNSKCLQVLDLKNNLTSTCSQGVEENLPQEDLKSVDELSDPKMLKDLKVIVEWGTSPFIKRAVKVTDYDITEKSPDDDNELQDVLFKSTVFNWSKGKGDNGKERLQLEVNKQDSGGMQKLVSKVSLSEQIPLYYSEPKETMEVLEGIKQINENNLPESEILVSCTSQPLKVEHSLSPDSQENTNVHLTEQPATRDVINNWQSENEPDMLTVVRDPSNQFADIHLTDKESNKDNCTSSMSSHIRSKENITIHETPLPQVLEEILKRGRISLSIPENLKNKNLKYSVSSSVVSKENISETVSSNNEEIKGITNTAKCVKGGDISYVQAIKEIRNEKLVQQKVNEPPCQETAVDNKTNLTFHSNEDATPASQIETLFEFNSSGAIEDVQNIQQELLHKTDEHLCEQKEKSVFIEKPKFFQVQNQAEQPVFQDHGSDEPVQDLSDNHGETLTFVIEPVGSLTEVSYIKTLKEDSDVDLELKLSEGDSIVEVPVFSSVQEEVAVEKSVPQFKNVQDEVVLEEGGEFEEEVNEELVYDTLKPVELQTEVEENKLQEDLYDDQCDEGDLETENVDIYGDIHEEEDKNKQEDQQDSVSGNSGSEQDNVDNSRITDVICLGSSSEEELPIKRPKTSTPYRQYTPRTPKGTKIPDETLDYDEDSYDDYEDEYEYSDEHREDDTYSESSGEGYDNNISENVGESSKMDKHYSSSESSESEVESISHGNRSWKKEKKAASDDSLYKDNLAAEEENTIESPPYELIGQDSQSEDNVGVHPGTKPEAMYEATEKSVVDKEAGQLKPSPEQNKENYESDGFQEERKTDSDLPVLDEPAKIVTEGKFDSQNFETTIGRNVISQINDHTADLVQLAEDKRRQYIETGSILDLKKRRSKRYSSDTNLSMDQRRKLRRRSRSLHDFTSMAIKEMATTSQQSTNKNEKWVAPVSINKNLPLDIDDEGASSFSLLSKSPLGKEEVQPSVTAQSVTAETESKGMSSKASSLHVEIGSVASAHLSMGSDTQSVRIEKQLGKSKRHGRPATSRYSSLQDISEEVSDNIVNSRNIKQSNEPLRRSMSTSNVTEPGHFKESLPRRSSSVSRWSEFAKAHESEMVSEIEDSLPSINEMDNVRREKKSNEYSSSVISLGSPPVTKRHQRRVSKMNSSLAIKTQQESTSFTGENFEKDEDAAGSGINLTEPLSELGPESFSIQTEFKRKQRAHSEPVSLSDSVNPPIRRSSSLVKIQKTHKKLFSRYSFRKRSSFKSNFQPLEIVHSDEDSLSESASVESTVKGHKENVSENVITSDNDNNDQVDSNNDDNKDQVEEEQKYKRLIISENFANVHSLNIGPESSNSKRKQRGQSEPPNLEISHTSGSRHAKSVRRSSSSSKLQTLHKLILRQSIRKSVVKSNFQPLEVIHSDEEKSILNTELYPSSSTKTEPEINVVENITSGAESDIEKDITTHKMLKKRGRKPKLHKEESANDNDFPGETANLGLVPSYDKSKPVTNIQQEGTTSFLKKQYPQPPKKRGRKPAVQQPVQSEICDSQVRKTSEEAYIEQDQTLKSGSSTLHQDVVKQVKKRQKTQGDSLSVDTTLIERKVDSSLREPEHVKEEVGPTEINTDGRNVVSRMTKSFLLKQGKKLKTKTSKLKFDVSHGNKKQKVHKTVSSVETTSSKTKKNKTINKDSNKQTKKISKKSSAKQKLVSSISKPLKVTGKQGRKKLKQSENSLPVKPASNEENACAKHQDSENDELNKLSVPNEMTLASLGETNEKNTVIKKSTKKTSIVEEEKFEAGTSKLQQVTKHGRKKLKTSAEDPLPDTPTLDEEHVSANLQYSKSFKEKAEPPKEITGSEASNDNEEIHIAPTKLTTNKKNLRIDQKKRKKINEPLISIDKKAAGPMKISPKNKRKLKEKVKESLTEYDSDVILEMSPTQSQKDGAPTNTHSKVSVQDVMSFLDVPAKRTRRSMSMLSDSSLLLTPTKEKELLEMTTTRRTRHSSAMSDIVLPTSVKHTYGDSETSDASASSKLTTPKRRSMRRQSFTAIPTSPELKPEEYLSNRRLTRYQHSQLHKSFDVSFSEALSVSRLEDLPEEDDEDGSTLDKTVSSTPRRASSRNTNRNLNYSMTRSSNQNKK